MARIRSIKPGYFTSLDTAGQLSRDARLHFAGLWTYADDEGRGLDEPRLIKAAVWALDDDIGAEQIEAMQDELARAGRIVRYTVGGKHYFEVVNWGKHQKPNRPQPSSYPGPDEGSERDQRTNTEPSVNGHGGDTDDSSREGRGEEGERERSVAPDKPAHERAERRRDEVFEALCEVSGLDWHRMPKNERGRVNAAAKQLREIEATPEGIRHRAKLYRQRWPGIDLTPTALVSNYTLLGTPQPNGHARDRPAEPVSDFDGETRRIAP